jgi:hypothetical protein
VNNGLKCDKCGEQITFEELSKRYVKAQKDGGFKDILACPHKDSHGCDGIMQEVIAFKKDDKGKTVLYVDGHPIST